MEKTQKYKTNKFLTVSLRAKEKLMYTGRAETISSLNERGPFDILPSHSNFITLIHGYLILDAGLPTEKKFDLEKGVLYTISDNVDVYVGI